MRKWFLTFVSIFIMMLLLLTACAPEVEVTPEVEEPAPADTTGDTTADEADDTADDTSAEDAIKVTTFAWTQEPDSLNPFYTDMWFSAILQQLYLCWPWEYDDQNVPYPNLLTEIPSLDNGGVSDDGLVITMNLRDDIVWSDGEPLTSADFLFTYEMAMADVNAVNSMYPYDYLIDLQAPDERTVVMTFEEPFAPWESTFWRGILPEHVLRPVFEADGYHLKNLGQVKRTNPN